MHCRLFLASVCCVLAVAVAGSQAATRPNVILVITDDQGYGDVGVHGNSMIRTPNLDKLHKQSVRLTDYHVDPTCSPTRAALMTGRYSTRTGVWHTIMGRSIMETKEVTVAEVFVASGYRTAMFGKWHLGDNYPCRPQDQGFERAFYHGGGGVGQTPDVFGNKYFDDTYFRNGIKEKAEGYCTDVWFREATKFIKANKDEPFFVYLSTNAPHGPFLVADKYSKPYRDRGVPGSMAAFYGMITNIDENMGRLTATLNELKLAENTILIFTTDNGTAAGAGRRRKPGGTAAGSWSGFNAGMRGAKGSEYDGGHRVPFFVRWPAGLGSRGRDEAALTAHIDVLPTLTELCGLSKPKDVAFDGISVAPVLKNTAASWPARTLLVHSQRIEHPQKGRKCSVMTKQFRLVNGKELYDIKADPGQQTNVAADYPEEFKRLSQRYDTWWKSLSGVFDDYVRISLGADAENPANLTCHDWHTNNGPVPWNHGHIRSGAMGNGFWAVNVDRAGQYEITLRRWPQEVKKSLEAVAARVQIGGVDEKQKVLAEATATTFKIGLKEGPARLQTWLTLPNGKQRGAYFVEVKRIAGP